jgi:predicted N-acetyltransferase YhbS
MRIEYLSNDARTIQQVAARLYGEWGHLSRGGTLATALRRISERAERRTMPLTFVAREDCIPVGTASLITYDMRTRLDLAPWLASVYVRPSYRRRGIGAALCRRVAREARELGYGRIYLFTYDKANFYKVLGWKQIQRTEYRRQKVTVMALG